MQKAKQALAQEDRDLDRIEDDSEQIEKERNPYDELLREQVRGIDQARDDLESLQARLDASNARFAMLTMWVRNFKEIRLQLIAEALDQLEIEANNEITALGLINWELQFDVDRETKSGSVARGFTVHVISPHNDEPVPWEAWSGGEAQRLRVGAQAGLSNLIRDRTGADIPLEVWDEPTQGLSEEGVLDLLDCLAARAKREDRQIWVVDHRSLGYGGFDGTATVVKTEAGSHIVQPRV
jgi:DNA repair exonuclease SbcCD ATPase subunit